MNPETNKFEPLQQAVTKDEIKKLIETVNEQPQDLYNNLLRPDGSPVPNHWRVFSVGEKYVINNYTFECKYIGETSILFEPIGPVLIGPER
jgi:hypothetical protein